MNVERGVADKLYYGIPRFVGELFRATKIPTIILLIGFIGVPLALSIYLTAYMAIHHSARPANLFMIGILEFKIESDPTSAQNLPPNLAKLMQTASAEDKALGKKIFEWLCVLSLIDAMAMFWWCYSVVRFLEDKAKGRMSSPY